MPRFLQLFLVLLLTTVSLPSLSQETAIVLTGGTIIDVDKFGRSAKDIKDAVVVIQRGKITAAGPRGRISIPEKATVIDVSGKYIVPGLIDGFGSVVNQAFANAYLYMGVTTVVSVEDNRRGKAFFQASPSPALYKQDAYWGADRVESKKPGQKFENINYRSDAEIDHEIDSMANNGAKVKHTSRYTADVLPDSVRAVYSNAPFGPPANFYYDYITSGDITEDKKLRELARLYGRSSVGLMPTASLLVYTYMPFAKNPWQEPIASIINERDIIHEPLDRKTGKPANFSAARAKSARVLLSMDSLLASQGARYLTGSGATAFGTLPGISLHTEMDVLSHAGLTNRQVLAAATNNFSLLWHWQHIGKIEAGRDADLLVLSGDPVQSLTHLKDIEVLIVKGQRIDRQRLMNAQ